MPPNNQKIEMPSVQTHITEIPLTDTNHVAHIEFKDGTILIGIDTVGTLVFEDVPESVFKEFITASNPWVYLDENIRDVYPFYSKPH